MASEIPSMSVKTGDREASKPLLGVGRGQSRDQSRRSQDASRAAALGVLRRPVIIPKGLGRGQRRKEDACASVLPIAAGGPKEKLSSKNLSPRRHDGNTGSDVSASSMQNGLQNGIQLHLPTTGSSLQTKSDVDQVLNVPGCPDGNFHGHSTSADKGVSKTKKVEPTIEKDSFHTLKCYESKVDTTSSKEDTIGDYDKNQELGDRMYRKYEEENWDTEDSSQSSLNGWSKAVDGINYVNHFFRPRWEESSRLGRSRRTARSRKERTFVSPVRITRVADPEETTARDLAYVDNSPVGITPELPSLLRRFMSSK